MADSDSSSESDFEADPAPAPLDPASHLVSCMMRYTINTEAVAKIQLVAEQKKAEATKILDGLFASLGEERACQYLLEHVKPLYQEAIAARDVEMENKPRTRRELDQVYYDRLSNFLSPQQLAKGHRKKVILI
jgi:hypothetical protein